jgi:hypothetical protein
MTRKLRLRLDALTVDSFEPGAAAPRNGTVHGQEAITAPNCPAQTVIQTCARKQTYYASCVAFCECTDAIRACLV